MTCMCGDTACPSCGPAQGYNPADELIVDWLADCVLVDFESSVDSEELRDDPIVAVSNFLLGAFGTHATPEFLEDMENEAMAWSRRKGK